MLFNNSNRIYVTQINKFSLIEKYSKALDKLKKTESTKEERKKERLQKDKNYQSGLHLLGNTVS